MLALLRPQRAPRYRRAPLNAADDERLDRLGRVGDRSVRALKGPGRPIQPEDERAEILAALEVVDYVTIFDDDTPRTVIARMLPNVLVKGGDWGPDEIVGRAEVEAAGGRVVSVPLTAGYSTSAMIREGLKTLTTEE